MDVPKEVKLSLFVVYLSGVLFGSGLIVGDLRWLNIIFSILIVWGIYKLLLSPYYRRL